MPNKVEYSERTLDPNDADKLNGLIDQLNANMQNGFNKEGLKAEHLIAAIASVLASTIVALDLDAESTCEVITQMVNDFHSGDLGYAERKQ